MFASNMSHRDRKPKYISKFSTKHGGDGRRWTFTPIPFLAPWPSRPLAIETPPRPVPAGPFMSWPKNASCSRIPTPTPSKPHLSLAATMSDDTLSALTPPLHCTSILQPATPPEVVAFESETISAPFCLKAFHFCWIIEIRSLNLCVRFLPFLLLPLLFCSK